VDRVRHIFAVPAGRSDCQMLTADRHWIRSSASSMHLTMHQQISYYLPLHVAVLLEIKVPRAFIAFPIRAAYQAHLSLHCSTNTKWRYVFPLHPAHVHFVSKHFPLFDIELQSWVT